MIKSYKQAIKNNLNHVNLYLLFDPFPFSLRNILEQNTHTFVEETKEIYIPLKFVYKIHKLGSKREAGEKELWS